MLSITAAALLVGAAAAAILAWTTGGGSDASVTTQPQMQTGPFRGAQIPPGKTAPDFTLESETGRPLRMADQRGKLVLVTFLYTHCEDVCPVIATGLDSVVRALGPKADAVRVIAVSVDPVGDTLPVVRAYMRSHRLGPQFHYLIGTREQLTPVWRDYNIVVRDDPDSVVHSAPVLLFDRRGRGRVYYSTPETPNDRRAIAHDLRVLLKGA